MILAERDFSRAIIDSLPGLFYIINSEGRFINWNRNLNTFTGCSDDELSQMLNAGDIGNKPAAGRVRYPGGAYKGACRGRGFFNRL